MAVMKPSCAGDTVLNFSEPVRSSTGLQGATKYSPTTVAGRTCRHEPFTVRRLFSMFIEVITMNHPNRVRLSKLSLGLLLALAAAPAFAQSTSAAIGGQVVGSDGQPDTRSGEYNNPVAVLNVTPPGGDKIRVFAFAQKLADNVPVGAPKAGYKWRLVEFEKSPLAHVLSIKYDPYEASLIAWYFGGFGLVGALIFVFFFSHKPKRH